MVMAAFVPRRVRWSTENTETTLRLVADDLDAGEGRDMDLAAAIQSLEATVNDRLTKIMWALVSVALTFSGTCAALVLTGVTG
jgi:hypothetical protein